MVIMIHFSVGVNDRLRMGIICHLLVVFLVVPKEGLYRKDHRNLRKGHKGYFQSVVRVQSNWAEK
jgi:hypothetical protein